MKRRSFIKTASIFTGSLAAAKLLSNPAQAQDLKELNFGIISTESQANQKPIWEPFISAMSEELGMPVKAFYATQYAGVIEAMRFGQVQLAWYGGKSYIEANEIADAEVFAQTVNDDGTKGYYSHLIMNKNHPDLAKAKEMGGDKYVLENASNLQFAFNDPNSTSGFLVPSYYVFAQNNVEPKEAFKRLIFAGNHEATALAIANNQVDVATNNSESLSRLEKTNPDARTNIETIWTSTLIPSDPIAWRADLPEELKTKVKDFFYNYSDESVLGPLEWQGFDPATDDMWNPIRELNDYVEANA
ncbi:MAG: phosphonate ABC transporter substrate-binding protein [Pleurocapsa sp. MO_192.B19]|nr:phosphonate ABC transporter substrate-binding protein [Pleurocapsa sp. MO_192.B19]